VSVRAGGVDWIDQWQRMMTASETCNNGEAGSADPWKHRAARFDRVIRQFADVGLDQLRMGVLPTDVVADIGAGTGRHAVPMSRHCREVIAVEPSPSMRARLQAHVDENGARVTVIAERWPCETPPVDCVYSSHVLYGVTDAVTFLEHMTRSARRTCKLLLGLRAPADQLASLWREVHGTERKRRPAALEALALLHQLGHAASLRIIEETARPMTFMPDDDDLNELCHRLHLQPRSAERARVQQSLDKLFPRASRSAPWLLGIRSANAIIEWPGTRNSASYMGK
jgi:SAM-dependent methyltransferase